MSCVSLFDGSLEALLRSIQPFDIATFKNYIVESEKSIEKVKGKEITLLIGETGVGKSTFVHVLAGSKLRHGVDGKIRHIEVEEMS